MQSRLLKVPKKFLLSLINKGQRRRKWVADSILWPQFHKEWMESWILCSNLCSLKWLKPSRSRVISLTYLTMIWVGFLGVRFEEGDKITPCLKLVRTMLKTSNLSRKYTHICRFWTCLFYYQGPFSTLNMSLLVPIFLMQHLFAKNQRFLSKIISLLKAIVWELC